MVQFGTNEEEAKVFRAHAVPQGLCENLINAFKLLANQQRDDDSPIQNLDNRCAVEVGHLRKGQRLFRVKITENR